jgi:hypothetical protein
MSVLLAAGDLMEPFTILAVALGLAGLAILILFAKDKV